MKKKIAQLIICFLLGAGLQAGAYLYMDRVLFAPLSSGDYDMSDVKDKVAEQAEKEGLDKIFIEAGFEWREPGCSMCLAMNDDRLASGERCASTSNRNFEGRQGQGGRTHLVSPAMAAAAGIAGHFVDVRKNH